MSENLIKIRRPKTYHLIALSPILFGVDKKFAEEIRLLIDQKTSEISFKYAGCVFTVKSTSDPNVFEWQFSQKKKSKLVGNVTKTELYSASNQIGYILKL